MKDIQKLLNSTLAGFIAQKLDAKDGKDGKISASVWNEFAAQYGGKSIKESISVADAMNSITTYAIRESKKAGKSTNELATEWLDTLTGGGSLSGITDGTTPPTVQPKAETKPGAKANPTITPSTVSDKESSITLTHNIDYRNEEGWTTQEVDAGDSLKATKHTKEGEADVYQMATNGINIHGSTVEEVRAKYDKWVKEFAAAPADESADNAQTRKAQNVQILKDKLEAADYSIDAIKALAADFRNDDLIDRNSDEYKSLVQNLLLTRNAEVIESLLSDGDDVDMLVVEKDKTAHEYLAGMYQEIRNKEKAGVMLSPEEIELKDTLKTRCTYDGYKIEADADKGIHEKYMSFANMDGKPMYQIFIGDNWYFAESPELLDEFLTKLDAADTDEKKAALFKEYINTGDKVLASCLAQNAKALKASDEDIISLINANGLEVLSALDNASDVEASDYSAEVIKSVVDRAKEIYTTDKGNLENAVYLGEVEKFISALPEDGENPIDIGALRKEILGTYFDKTETTDEAGNTTTTYPFNPSRRPTYEEMYGLASLAIETSSSEPDFKAALVDYIKLEDMGGGQYNEAIEDRYGSAYTVPHYAKMVEGMSTASDITDFIDNKVATDRDCHLPYDAIIAKLEGFSEDEKKQILDRLVKYAGGGSKISDENKLLLAKHCMQIDAEGNVTFDKSKLPEGVTARKILDYFLPKDCTEGDAKKYFDAIFNTLDLSNDDILSAYNNHDFSIKAHERLIKLVLENPDKAGGDVYNRIVAYLLNTSFCPGAEDLEKIYNASTDAIKRSIIYSGKYTKDGALVVVKFGDSVDKIVKNYLTNHLDKFPQLKESIESDPSKWTPERIDEALDDYMNDFRNAIMQDLGITDPTKLKADQILDLSLVQWDKHQPGWWNYNFTY